VEEVEILHGPEDYKNGFKEAIHRKNRCSRKASQGPQKCSTNQSLSMPNCKRKVTVEIL